MSLLDKIKNVIEDGDTTTQIRDKICEEYHGFFIKKVRQHNDDVKETKEQLQAEIGIILVTNADIFSINRNQGQLSTYSVKTRIQDPMKVLSAHVDELSKRMEVIETDHNALYEDLTLPTAKPVKKASWWSRFKFL